MSAVALLGATEAHIARISDLETRAAALWAAENMLAELTLGVAPETAPEPMLGIDFALAVTSSPTQDPDLTRVDITASAAGGPVLARLTGFLDARAAGRAASR